jgi:hypothetical protein
MYDRRGRGVVTQSRDIHAVSTTLFYQCETRVLSRWRIVSSIRSCDYQIAGWPQGGAAQGYTQVRFIRRVRLRVLLRQGFDRHLVLSLQKRCTSSLVFIGVATMVRLCVMKIKGWRIAQPRRAFRRVGGLTGGCQISQGGKATRTQA